MRFHNKVVLITGAAGGLGSVYARAMTREGASVIAVDTACCEPLVQEIIAADGNAMAVRADLTKEEEVQAMVDKAIDQFGRIDVLVNNAGTGRVRRRADIDDVIDLEQWRKLMEINLTSAVYCSNFVARHMRKNKYGRIINVSSRAARSVGWFSGVSTGYICSKIAVLGLTRDLATRLGPDGITVNCIVPGFVVSGPAMQTRWDEMSASEQQRMLMETPLRRMPRSEEISNVVLFLASDDASYVTGASIDVNGGSSMS